jgi:hypothetical protein
VRLIHEDEGKALGMSDSSGQACLSAADLSSPASLSYPREARAKLP